MAAPETIEVPITPTWIPPVMPVGIYGALAEAAGAMRAIEKDQKNTGQNFMFRSIETIVAAAKPILADLEISIVPTSSVSRHEEVTSGQGSRGWRCIVEMTWQISHSDGSFIVAAQSGEAVDYGDKSTSKASQMAFKYMLTQMLGIGSEDPDGETADVGEAVSPTDQIRKRANAVKEALFKETKEDADAAQSLWDGILDHLQFSEPLTESQMDAVEKAAGDERPM